LHSKVPVGTALARIRQEGEGKVGPTAVVLPRAAPTLPPAVPRRVAARGFPAFNGFYRDSKFEPASAVHVGVAIAIRGGGLAAPALHDADQVSLAELMSRMRDLVQRTRTGRIRSSEISDPTITVSSLGEHGVETLYGVIYPPQVAIVGFGKALARPWVIDGAIGTRSVIDITLSGDHRVADGHVAEIGKLLQEPSKL
jgi:pyruvate dehydrogenase E2 component (dihydrolipoamide acetyltransferase)